MFLQTTQIIGEDEIMSSNSNIPGDKTLRSGDLAMIVRPSIGRKDGKEKPVGQELVNAIIRVAEKLDYNVSGRCPQISNPCVWTFSESSRPLEYDFFGEIRTPTVIPEAILMKIADGNSLNEKETTTDKQFTKENQS